MRRYFAVQVCFELKWELHEYFRVVCCDFCYSRLPQLCFAFCIHFMVSNVFLRVPKTESDFRRTEKAGFTDY